MRAMRLYEYGAALQMDNDAPTPTPGDGEIRIKLSACGVNFADTLLVKGTYQEKPEPPFSPGMEGVGVVDMIGPGCEGAPAAKLGARVVAAPIFGGFAEYALAPAAACVLAPGGVSDAAAAASSIAYGTSELALNHRAELQPGERLLVLGAAGGVGLTAVEIGKLMGAEVIAVARGAEKLEIARSKGADHLIDAAGEDAPERIRTEVKALGGADVVYDPVGGEQWKAALRAANPEARLLPIGFASGEVPQIPANILLVKNLTVLGLYWGAYRNFAPSVIGASLEQVFCVDLRRRAPAACLKRAAPGAGE